ncbi:Ppx/GppA family phosphatase [Bacillus marasmi]|uniref:Ppx/GppA family phosphatase n=1 Tax=Bacillus marasmi TaxID=1926279 RepID=UPI00319E75EE
MYNEYGIIDIGSNTMRLVIYKRDLSGRLMEIENVKIVARLRVYLNNDRILSAKGISLLIRTLLSFQEVTRHHQIKEVKCVATASIRQAKNQQQILAEVEKQTDFSIRILSEYEEAYFGYFAVLNSFAIDEAITIDIGGGSTEVTYFNKRELIEYHSFPFGALALKKQFVSGEVPTLEENQRISTFVQQNFETLDWLKNKQVPVIAIGGSARNMAQIHQAITKYPLADIHQYEMALTDIQEVKELLAPLSFSQLTKVDGLASDRADIIMPAVLVFEQIMDTSSTTTFLISRKGLRDGIFYKELSRPHGSKTFKNVVEKSLFLLAQDYEVDQKHAKQVSYLALSIFTQLQKLALAEFTDEDLFYLMKGASIYNFGEHVSNESSSEHTFYLLTNRMIDGMKHKDRVKLALISSYKKKDLFRQFVEHYQHWYTKNELKKMRLLGAILKLANSLNSTKRNVVDCLKLSVSDGTILLEALCKKDWKPEEYQANKQKKHLEKALKRNIEILFS